MNDSNLGSELPPTSGSVTPEQRRLAGLWIETVLVLLLVVIPHLTNSIASHYLNLGPERPAFAYQAAITIVRSVGAIALIMFLVARSAEPFSAFGLKRPRIIADLFGGVGVFLLGIITNYLIWFALEIPLGARMTARLLRHDLTALAAPSGAASYVMLCFMSLANGLAEEMVMRAYLIRRFEQLSRSTILALLATTLLFASYHGYQGSGGVISAAAIGLVYGSVFCLSRRVWPLAAGHAIQDFIGIAMLKR